MSSSPLFWNDSQGNKFETRITIGDATRMRASGRDLMDGKFLESLFGDPLKLIETIAEANRPQWEGKMTYEQFADAITHSEETYVSARKAFKSGVEDFFRRLNQLAMADLVEKAFAIAEQAGAQMKERINGEPMGRMLETALKRISDDFDRKIEEEIEKINRGE